MSQSNLQIEWAGSGQPIGVISGAQLSSFVEHVILEHASCNVSPAKKFSYQIKAHVVFAQPR